MKYLTNASQKLSVSPTTIQHIHSRTYGEHQNNWSAYQFTLHSDTKITTSDLAVHSHWHEYEWGNLSAGKHKISLTLNA